MIVWGYKDADEVLDFSWQPPIDEGDTIVNVTAANVTRISGDATVDSVAEDGGTITAYISGGTDGTESVFRLTATTSGGRTFEDHATLSIADTNNALIGAFRARYPAFSDVPDASVRLWLDDAARIVTDDWSDTDREPARLALAAHSLAMQGLGKTPGGDAALPAGVTRFKSADVDISLSSEAAAIRAKGGYGATIYGQEFRAMLRRRLAGPRTVAVGTIPPGVR